MRPHKCPVCEGTGSVRCNAFKRNICPACAGKCVLWGPREPKRLGGYSPEFPPFGVPDIILGPNGRTDPSSAARMMRRLLGD